MSPPKRRTLRRADADPAVLVEINTTPRIDVSPGLAIMLDHHSPYPLHPGNLNPPVRPPPSVGPVVTFFVYVYDTD